VRADGGHRWVLHVGGKSAVLRNAVVGQGFHCRIVDGPDITLGTRYALLPVIADVRQHRVMGLILTPPRGPEIQKMFCRLARVAATSSVPWILLVPASAVSSIVKELESLDEYKTFDAIIEQCAYGANHRGSLRIIAGNLVIEDCARLRLRCNGRDSLCPYTSRPHGAGQAYGGVNLPTDLARDLAHVILAPTRCDVLNV
jgi:hypothetical protein